LEISFLNELKRKAIHLFALIIPVSYYFLPQTTALLIYIFVALASITVDIIRIKKYHIGRVFTWILRPILRRHERRGFTGSSYILSAMVLSIIFFEKNIAVAVISFVIVGDLAAALVGRTFGKLKIINEKSLEGSSAFLVSCLLIIWAVPDFPFGIGVIGALVATVVEALPLPIDDNFTVPLFSGLVMEILYLA
jgi:dolichol kinase